MYLFHRHSPTPHERRSWQDYIEERVIYASDNRVQAAAASLFHRPPPQELAAASALALELRSSGTSDRAARRAGCRIYYIVLIISISAVDDEPQRGSYFMVRERFCFGDKIVHRVNPVRSPR